MNAPGDEPVDLGLLRAAPVFLRLAAVTWLRAAEWSLVASARAGTRVVRAAAAGESPGDFLAEVGAELRDYGRELLGMNGARPSEAPEEPAPGREHDPREPARAAAAQDLRRRGAELLRRSADVEYREDAHPAYGRILDDLAPDEARILRLLCRSGAQPAVDVRQPKPLNLGSQLVAPGLSMIGAEAGCRYVERVPAYLNNLYRLGLIWFSREPLEDPLRYQVLEAQPEVQRAIAEAGRGKTVRRSIHRTPFGEDFCRICLPVDTGEFEALVDRE